MADQELFVYNVPYDATEGEISNHFEQVGEVKRVHIPKDRETGNPRGFVFVTMDESHIEEAIEKMHESTMAGRILTVKKAEGKKKPTQRA